MMPARSARPFFCGETLPLDTLESRFETAHFGCDCENAANPFSFGFIDDEPPTFRVYIVAEHGRAADSLALSPRCPKLVSCALADDLALKLRILRRTAIRP